MSTPYTYCITHKPSGKRYYGARWGKDCHPADLWVKYFTSSKHVKKLIEKDGVDSFDREIRKVFKDQQSCVRWEQKVLVRLGIPNNPNWINLNCATSLTSEEWRADLIANHGVDHPSKIPGWQEQLKKTSMKRYGVEFAQQTPEVQSRIQNTMRERFGYDNSSQHPKIKERITSSLVEYYKLAPLITCPSCGYSCKSAGVMKQHHFDKCVYHRIVALHEEGLSPSEIQALLGLHAHSVSKYLQDRGLKPNRPKKMNLSMGASNCRQVTYEGVTYRSINAMSKELKINQSRINKMILSGEVVISNDMKPYIRNGKTIGLKESN